MVSTVKAILRQNAHESICYCFGLLFHCFSVQIKHKNCKNINTVQQQCEHCHYKVMSFHLSGDTFKISLDSSGFRSFLGLVKFAFGSESWVITL